MISKGGGWDEPILGTLFGIVLLANPLIGAVYLLYVLCIFSVIGVNGAIISAFLLRPET